MSRLGAKKKRQAKASVAPTEPLRPVVQEVNHLPNYLWIEKGLLKQVHDQVLENQQREVRQERDGVREKRAVFYAVQLPDGTLETTSELPHGMRPVRGKSHADLHYQFALSLLKARVFGSWPRCLKASRESTFIVLT